MKHDLASAKKSLNTKQLEYTRLMNEINENNSNNNLVDKDTQELSDQLEIYTEIEERLIWETNEILQRRKIYNNDLQNIKGNIRVQIRVKPTVGKIRIYNDKDCNDPDLKSCITVLDKRSLKLSVPTQVGFRCLTIVC